MSEGRDRPEAGTGGLARSATIVLTIGLGLVLAATIIVADDLRAMKHAESATGVYLDSVARSGGNHGGTFLHPRFAFRTAPGQPLRTVTSASGSTDEEYGKGDEVRVYFDVASPEKAWIASFWDLWFGPTVLAAIGAVVVAVGVLLALLNRRSRVC